MKIAFDAKRAFRNSSGLGNYSRMVIRQLCEYYPQNEYIMYSPKNGSIDPDFPPHNAKLILPKKPVYKFFNAYWRSYHLKNILEKENPDIFHGLSNEIPFNLHKTKVKTIVTIHDLIFIRFPDLYRYIDRKIYSRKFRYASENADLVIAASEQTKKDIIEFFGIPEKKIKVVYQSGNPMFSHKLNSDEINWIKNKYNTGSEYILNLGTIEERKNLLQLLKALRESQNKTQLVVVGQPKKKYFQKVQEFIRKNRLNNIRFLQNVPTSDLPALYQGASLFVYPSSFEGFGIPVLEAIQSGTPVIAGAGHCLEETGGPESIYIDPFKTEKFADIIDKVLDNSDLRQKMEEAGKKHAEQFLPHNTVKNLYSVYEGLQGT